MTKNLTSLYVSVLVFISASNALAAVKPLPTPEEMWQIIQRQQKQIDALTDRLTKTEVRSAEVAQKTAVVEQQVEATSSFVESMVEEGGVKSSSQPSQTALGGYGELHYNAGASDQLDFHRFVLFVNHEFSDSIRFFSELEVEHAFSGEGKPGEVELEQAYLEFDINDHAKAKAGIFLLPIGILNETHEPNTFYGVERNRVENAIIPATWWEGGIAYTQQSAAGLSWDIALHSGLKNTQANIRSGRQKVAKADAQDGAVTTRIKYTGTPGLELAASLQVQQDIAQSTLPGETAGAMLMEAHADWRKNGFGLRALYARWDLDGATAAGLGRDKQFGYYIEPSYRFDTGWGDLGFFVRFTVLDNIAGDSADSEQRYTNIGFNYWPHAQVVLKADLEFLDLPSRNDETVNLGLGYQF